MTPKPHRLRRILKWIGLALCLCLSATWIGSRWWGFRWMSSDVHLFFGISGGCVHVGMLDEPVPGARSSPVIKELLETGVYQRDSRARAQSRPCSLRIDRFTLVTAVAVPLWMPLILVLTPTIGLCWRDRRVPAGHCPSCGYNLTGNVTGRCPECGKPIAPGARR